MPAVSTGVTLVQARALMGRPWLDPPSPKKSAHFHVKGSISPGHSSATTIQLVIYKKVRGQWVWQNSPVYTLGKCKTSYSLPLRLGKGTWRVYARHQDSSHARTSSAPRDFKVK